GAPNAKVPGSSCAFYHSALTIPSHPPGVAGGLCPASLCCQCLCGPVAAFSASPTSGQAPVAVTFTDASTGSPTAWLWKFGDGTRSILQSPIHTYTTAGTYTVQLTVTGPGGSNTAIKTSCITVAPALLEVGELTRSEERRVGKEPE